MMHSEKLFCLDDPVGQNRICSLATVIYCGSSIILNRLPFIYKVLALKDEGKTQVKAFNENLVTFQRVSMRLFFSCFLLVISHP